MLCSFLCEFVDCFHTDGSFVTRSPVNTNFDVREGSKDVKEVVAERNGCLLGRMGGAREDDFESRRGVAE